MWQAFLFSGLRCFCPRQLGHGIAQDDQPAFAKVTYTLTTYGLIVPVSNELANDEVANLFGYLARWFAKKQILTENALLKTKLETLTAGQVAATDNAVDALREDYSEDELKTFEKVLHSLNRHIEKREETKL